MVEVNFGYEDGPDHDQHVLQAVDKGKVDAGEDIQRSSASA